jgi:hypothetical protein
VSTVGKKLLRLVKFEDRGEEGSRHLSACVINEMGLVYRCPVQALDAANPAISPRRDLKSI